jgi:hypothetical protein
MKLESVCPLSIDDPVALDIGRHGNENPIYVLPVRHCLE